MKDPFVTFIECREESRNKEIIPEQIRLLLSQVCDQIRAWRDILYRGVETTYLDYQGTNASLCCLSDGDTNLVLMVKHTEHTNTHRSQVNNAIIIARFTGLFAHWEKLG